jgi:hypothetical protein
MAHVTLLDIPASAFIGDNDAQLVAGDVLAPLDKICRRNLDGYSFLLSC